MKHIGYNIDELLYVISVRVRAGCDRRLEVGARCGLEAERL